MQLRQEQLNQHLISNKLAPIYLVSGAEPLLIEESCDAIIKAAAAKDFSERNYLVADKSFNWQELLTTANNLSLFSTKTLIQLRIPNAKPGTTGSKTLQEYAKKLPTDKILLIVTDKLDAAAQKSKWFKALEKAGVFLPIWPIDRSRLPNWLALRLQQEGLKTDTNSLNLLADYVEGNLLAAKQEIEKLRLLYGETTLTTTQITQAISDNARFSIFDLADSALQSNKKKSLRILHSLQSEKTEPILIVWVLAKELRSLAKMAYTKQEQNSAIEQILQQYHVWPMRKPIIKHALQTHKYSTIMNLLKRCALLDRIIKGAAAGNIWNELEQLCLSL